MSSPRALAALLSLLLLVACDSDDGEGGTAGGGGAGAGGASGGSGQSGKAGSAGKAGASGKAGGAGGSGAGQGGQGGLSGGSGQGGATGGAGAGGGAAGGAGGAVGGASGQAGGGQAGGGQAGGGQAGAGAGGDAGSGGEGGSAGSASGGGSGAGSGGGAGQACAPPLYESFTLTQDVALGCDGNDPSVVFDVQPGRLGRAVGRARLVVRYPGMDVIHFWSGRVEIGAATLSYNVGDDVCPGVVATRATMGLGELTAEKPRARVLVHSGASPCTPGTLLAAPGSTLEVWTEDSTPGCQGKAIAAGSYYASAGGEALFEWQTSMLPLTGVTASLTTEAPGETIRVMGVVEGTPLSNPNNVCGSEASTLVMQTALDGVTMATVTDVVPASQGMGHLVLATSGDANELRTVAPGAHTASLLVGSNFVGTVTTGGCCGDGMVALVRSW